jgi:hypothetical protein
MRFRTKGVKVSKGILLVETRPASSEEAADYHRWYEETHLKEIVELDGFVSARRFEPVDDGAFVAIYEIDGDVAKAQETLAAAYKSGSMSKPVGVQMDPPPSMRFFRHTTTYG